MNFKIILGTLFICFILSSCQDQKSIHEEYVDLSNGEIKYAPKAANVVFSPGNERAEFKINYFNAFKVVRTTIEWEGGQHEFDVVPKIPTDSIFVTVDGLPEEVISFNIYNWDVEGNRSVRYQEQGKVYGNIYQKNLSQKIISESCKDMNDDLELSFVGNFIDLVSTVISYTDSNGTDIEKIVEKSEFSMLLSDFPPNGVISYYSIYVPEGTSIDEFITETTTYTPSQESCQ